MSDPNLKYPCETNFVSRSHIIYYFFLYFKMHYCTYPGVWNSKLEFPDINLVYSDWYHSQFVQDNATSSNIIFISFLNKSFIPYIFPTTHRPGGRLRRLGRRRYVEHYQIPNGFFSLRTHTKIERGKILNIFEFKNYMICIIRNWSLTDKRIIALYIEFHIDKASVQKPILDYLESFFNLWLKDQWKRY